ncbi:MAG: alkane 1-monooxygenase [Bauldia sp.]|nr:alkane 1-monooxygenase [Bauldia sp.]
MFFLLLPILTLLFCGAFFLGGIWLSATIILIWVIAIPVDEIVGDDWERYKGRKGVFLSLILYAQLPTLILGTFLAAYYVSDWTFLGSAINEARDTSAPRQTFMAFFTLGLFYGIAGINVAHELIHRNSKVAVNVGRWLLSFSFDTGFALEHVYGHHLHVGMPSDPATARRGQNFWPFLGGMIWRANKNAWDIEKRFLTKRGQRVWSLKNRFITGQLMSLTWVVLFAIAGGWRGVLVFLAMAFAGKLYLEMTNYIEHYGLVRAEGTRVDGRHSWNSGRKLTNFMLFNLPRHSDHHVKPGKPYWELDSRKDAPQLPYGYFIMAVLATIPPLFHRVMQPYLESWDRDFASPEERAIIAASGWKPRQQASAPQT